MVTRTTRTLSVVLIFLILSFPDTNAQSDSDSTLLYKFCQNDTGYYANSSVYKTNLDTLLSDLPTTNGNGYGFYNLSAGEQGVDGAYAIGLCRGDVTPEECRSCLENATHELPQVCPNQKEVVGWYEYCMLRYSNRSLAGRWEKSQTFFMSNLNNASSPDAFSNDLLSLLMGLKNSAALGGPLQKFKTGNTSGPNFSNIYALVQCSPDLSRQDCNNCLDNSFGYIPQCCGGRIGARVMGPSCNFRYETRLFYRPTEDVTLEAIPPSPPPAVNSPPPAVNSPPSNATTTRGNGSNTWVLFIVFLQVLCCTIQVFV